MQTWYEFHITTTAAHASALSDSLMLLGAQAITMRDGGNEPIYEPALHSTPVWQEIILVSLFDSDESMEPIGLYLEKQRALGLLKQFNLHVVPEEDWTRRCLESFKPLQFGKRLCICPSWLTPPNPNGCNVMLDPGLAFGTGTHATTALCLEWLGDHIESQDVIIDYGCGSGILAISALKLGAKKAYAVDHDPQALQATQNNGERNQLTFPRLETLLPENFSPEPASVLIANILAQPLIELAPLFATYVKSGGNLVLSGVLADQAESVLRAYSPWFEMLTPAQKEDWIRLDGTRK